MFSAIGAIVRHATCVNDIDVFGHYVGDFPNKNRFDMDLQIILTMLNLLSLSSYETIDDRRYQLEFGNDQLRSNSTAIH